MFTYINTTTPPPPPHMTTETNYDYNKLFWQNKWYCAWCDEQTSWCDSIGKRQCTRKRHLDGLRWNLYKQQFLWSCCNQPETWSTVKCATFDHVPQTYMNAHNIKISRNAIDMYWEDPKQFKTLIRPYVSYENKVTNPNTGELDPIQSYICVNLFTYDYGKK